MPDKAYTVSPVISTDENGQEFINDFNVSTGHQEAVGRDGMTRGWKNDYIEDSEGRYHHMFEGVELESDQDDSTFKEEQYIEALIEANPEITAAQKWAVENLPEAWVEDYDKMIESGSLDELNKAVEWLLEQYSNRAKSVDESSTPDQELEDDEPELTEEDEEVIYSAVETLAEQEAMGDEAAEQWQYAVQQAEESGDEAYAQVAAATAAFHSGEVTAKEAISFCIENVPLKDLARIYKHMME